MMLSGSKTTGLPSVLDIDLTIINRPITYINFSYQKVQIGQPAKLLIQIQGNKVSQSIFGSSDSVVSNGCIWSVELHSPLWLLLPV